MSFSIHFLWYKSQLSLVKKKLELSSLMSSRQCPVDHILSEICLKVFPLSPHSLFFSSKSIYYFKRLRMSSLISDHSETVRVSYFERSILSGSTKNLQILIHKFVVSLGYLAIFHFRYTDITLLLGWCEKRGEGGGFFTMKNYFCNLKFFVRGVVLVF